MKKIISLFTAAAMCASMGATAFAEGFAESMDKAAEDSAISIIYNGRLMTYTDAVPENINDRVMLPFRAVLENMGAKVDYDDSKRLVTASRGTKTIKFTLLDDTIYISDNGVDKQIKLDVPMVIKNDRTLVPVRFISNSLGMQIGWEGDYQTVFIVDSEAYADELEAGTPNLTAAAEKNNELRYNTGTVDVSLEFKSDLAGGERESLFFAFNADSAADASAASVKGTLSLDLGDGSEIPQIENSELEIIAADGKIYIKSDAIGKLVKDKPKIGALAAALAGGSRWFYFDVNSFVDKVFAQMPDGVRSMYKSLLSGNMTAEEGMSVSDIIASLGATGGDATLDSAYQADLMIDAYKALDRYITVTGDKVEIKVAKDDFIKIMEDMGISEAASAEELKKIADILTVDVYAVAEYGEAEASSKAEITFGMKDKTNDVMLTLKINETQKYDENASAAEVPESAIDLMQLIK